MAELLEVILRNPFNFIGTLVLVLEAGVILVTVADKFSPYEVVKKGKKEKVLTGKSEDVY